jgi:hypothetical protein
MSEVYGWSRRQHSCAFHPSHSESSTRSQTRGINQNGALDDGRRWSIELSKPVRVFLPIMFEALRTAGTTMQVWRQEGAFDEKLLYEPRFAEPGPHWGDVNQDNWADFGRWED